MKIRVALYLIIGLFGTGMLSAQGLKIGNYYKRAVEFSMGNGNYLPLIVEACGMEKIDMPYFSYFIPRINVAGGVISRRYDTAHYASTLGYRMINIPLKSILITAYKNEFGDNQTNRILVETKNKEMFNWPDTVDTVWKFANTWCYDIKVPLSKAPRLDSIIREDFERAFDVKLSVEKRKVHCLALVKSANFIPTKSIENGYVRNVNGKGLEVRGASTSVLIYLFKGANESLATPIVDDTNFGGQLDIDLTTKLRLSPDNIQAVRDNLNKYGLDLIPKDKIIDMLIIKDAQETNYRSKSQ